MKSLLLRLYLPVPLKLAALGVGAVALWTGLIVAASGLRTHANRQEFAMKIGRQVATQAEGLLLAARSRAEKDPLGWAVLQLSQGVEPRVIRVQKADLELLSSRTELGRFSEKGTEYDYLKKIGPEDRGGAIRVTIESPFEGFLGTRAKWMSDLAILLFFIGSGALGYTLWALHESRKRMEGFEDALLASPSALEPEVRVEIREVIKEVIREVPVPQELPPISLEEKFAWGVRPDALWVWSLEVTTGLRELGLATRDVLRGASEMMTASGAIRNGFDTALERLQKSLKAARLERSQLQALSRAATKAEGLSMNVALAALRLSHGKVMSPADLLEQRESLRRDAEALLSALQNMRERSEERLRAAETFTTELEPCLSDLESCIRSQDPVFQRYQSLEEPTRLASEHLIAQARLLKKIPTPEKIPVEVEDLEMQSESQSA
jgi:hypothetical protein